LAFLRFARFATLKGGRRPSSLTVGITAAAIAS
jgi:hypothetical protein